MLYKFQFASNTVAFYLSLLRELLEMELYKLSFKTGPKQLMLLLRLAPVSDTKIAEGRDLNS